MKKIGLQGSEYNFSVDYNNINSNYIVDFHKYLNEKNVV